MKLERASVSVASLALIATAVIGGGIYIGALAGDVKNNKEDVKKIPVLAANVANLKTGQAVMAERMKTLDESVKELKEEQKNSFKDIIDKLNELNKK